MPSKPLVLTGPDDLSRRPNGERIDLGVLNIGPPGPPLVIDGVTESVTLPGTSTVHTLIAPNNANRVIRNVIGGEVGDILILARGPASPSTPRVLEGGNLELNGGFNLNGTFHNITLYRFGAGWVEIGRSPNGN